MPQGEWCMEIFSGRFCLLRAYLNIVDKNNTDGRDLKLKIKKAGIFTGLLNFNHRGKYGV